MSSITLNEILKTEKLPLSQSSFRRTQNHFFGIETVRQLERKKHNNNKKRKQCEKMQKKEFSESLEAGLFRTT